MLGLHCRVSAGSKPVQTTALVSAPKIQISKVQVTQVDIEDIVALRKQIHVANKARGSSAIQTNQIVPATVVHRVGQAQRHDIEFRTKTIDIDFSNI